MIRMLVLALAASLLPCAGLAQTVTSPTLIPGTTPAAPKSLKLVSYAGKVTPKVKKNTPVFGPCNDAAPFAYSITASCPVPPVVTPAPTPDPVPQPVGAFTLTPAVKDKTLGEAFTAGDRVVIGLSDAGTLGTVANAPAAFQTPGMSYARKGYAYLPTRSDFLVVGATADVWLVGYYLDGVQQRIVQGPLIGKTDIHSAPDAQGVWTGHKGCVSVRQATSLLGARVTFAVTLTNTCDRPIERLAYVRYQDVDDGEIDYTTGLPTQNTVAAIGTAEAKLLGRSKGVVYRLSSSDVTARAGVGGFIVEDPYNSILTSRAVGYSVKTADANLDLSWSLGTIAPRASTTINFVISAD